MMILFKFLMVSLSFVSGRQPICDPPFETVRRVRKTLIVVGCPPDDDSRLKTLAIEAPKGTRPVEIFAS
jgi:hypothetical protein